MMSAGFNIIFNEAIQLYHETDDVDAPMPSYTGNELEQLLFLKCWIDIVQWHLEDIIRRPDIEPSEALLIKRRIDASNQQRTDVVEQADDYFLHLFNKIKADANAGLNTESIGWAIDRLSILALKIFHMQLETQRTDATKKHIELCKQKLAILNEQRTDLSAAIDELINDIQQGRKQMKVYRQMKMYNDPTLNPVLYKK